MNENDFIEKYNLLCNKHTASNSSLSDLTDEEFEIWITGKTIKFGRSYKDSLVNAKLKMKDRKRAEKLFGFKKKDFLI